VLQEAGIDLNDPANDTPRGGTSSTTSLNGSHQTNHAHKKANKARAAIFAGGMGNLDDYELKV
jgi:hypothetical protein